MFHTVLNETVSSGMLHAYFYDFVSDLVAMMLVETQAIESVNSRVKWPAQSKDLKTCVHA